MTKRCAKNVLKICKRGIKYHRKIKKFKNNTMVRGEGESI